MNRERGSLVTASLLVAFGSLAMPARAELYKDVARGLALLDYQFSGERNVLGDGVTVNANASYNNRTFDFGVANLTLTGGVSASAGFTRRGIPGANFSLNTRGSSLSYVFEINNGMQDLVASGSALVNVQSRINALGFYDTTAQISNRGTYETNGLADAGGTLDFDLGPVVKSGNLYIDVLAAITQPLFESSGAENPFAKLSAQATRITSTVKSLESLQARAVAGELLSDAELGQLINASILNAVLGGSASDVLLEDLTSMQSSGLGIPLAVPEPAILTPLAMALSCGVLRRRRRA